MKTIRRIRAFGRLLGMIGLLAPVAAQAQRDTTAVAGPQYAKGALYRLVFGTDYRALWTTPVRAPVLDLHTFAGGLTPTTAGGGFQTKSLRFRAADSSQYGFRSVDKDPGVLPEELDSTFIRDIVKDQTRSGHPGAPAVAGPLLEAAGIPHADETLVVLPDDPALGEHRARFAGTLGFFSRRTLAGGPGFHNTREIIDSRELFPRIRRSADDLIDERALLTARLMDMYLGDWDRHRFQFSWARFTDAGPVRWVPIPEDRDQAFARFDGLLPGLARQMAAPFLVAFSDKYSSVVGWGWTGRDVDRWFLGEPDRAVLDSIAATLQARLTDSVIDAAVRRLPDAWYDLNGERLARALKRRRDDLPRQAGQYYRMLAREAEVHGTAADEEVSVDRLESGRITLRLARRGARDAWFTRTYDPTETSEVRLFTRGGADRVALRGAGPAHIIVRLIADSQVTVTDSSRVGGLRRYDAAWTPSARRGAARISRKPQRPGDELDEPTPATDWGTRNQPIAQVAFGPDIGLFLGYGVTHTSFGFRRRPFASQWRVSGGWATAPVTGRLAVSATIHPEQSEAAIELGAYASGLEVVRWNGLGNATTVTQPKTYYYVDQRQVGLEARLALPVGRRAFFRFGPALRFSRTLVQAGRIIADSMPYGAGNYGQAGFKASYDLDTRDIPGAATRGVTFTFGGSAYPALWGVDSAFGEVHAVASTYLTARHAPLRPTLALRAGAKHVSGHVPFHEAAYIGDGSTVRLGAQNRYGGDNAVWGNAEVRLSLTRFFVILPGQLGLFGLADVGRVSLTGESSEQWHGAVGGGVWISLLQPANVLTAAVARSRDRTALYVAAGFAY